MRLLVFILLSVTLPARADLGTMVKDAIRNEIERKMPPTQSPYPVPESEKRKVEIHYNTHWRMSARLGPITYRDDNLEDRSYGRFSFRPQGGVKSMRPENLTKFTLEIRKEF